MSHEFYRVVHILAVLMVFVGLAAQWGVRSQGGQPGVATRMFVSLVHGFGLLILLATGLPMLAQLGWANSVPVWAIGKIAIWLLLGGALALAKRKPAWGVPLMSACLALGGLAAYFAIYKPV